MKQSKFFFLAIPDWIKSAIMAALGSIGGFIYNLFKEWANNQPIHFDKVTLVVMLKGAIAAAAPYIVKNLFTNSQDKFLKTENSITNKPQLP